MTIESQIITDVGVYDFDFSDYFRSTSTISSISVAGSAGLLELSAKRASSGQTQYLFIDVSGCTAGLLYTLACQATGSAGEKKTLYKTIRVIAEPVGITAVPGAAATTGIYSATWSQSGTSAPSAAVVNANTLTGTPVLTRSSEGVYVATLAGAFLANKTRVLCHLFPYLVGNESSAVGRRLTDDTVEVRVYDFAGNLVDGFSILHVDIETYA